MTDIFELQEEIARLVSARIATELGIAEQQRAVRQTRKNLGAWELYQLGSIEFYRFTGESNRRCQRLMRQAIQQDPDFGSPYARLAYAMILEMVYFDGQRDEARLDEALSLALRGVDHDDQDANTFFSLDGAAALDEALRLTRAGSRRRSAGSRPRSTSARTTRSAGPSCRIARSPIYSAGSSRRPPAGRAARRRCRTPISGPPRTSSLLSAISATAVKQTRPCAR
jgi:hypothetical protein